MAFDTPILILAFNRPDYLLKSISILRAISASNVYIHVDGPRDGRKDDELALSKIKQNLKLIDWKCTVHSNFQENNLGCKIGVSKGISWFFTKVEAGIILEDDCMPDESFFQYSSELLVKYRSDKRVGMISGSNFFNDLSTNDSYFYSVHPNCWGWATWKRAWDLYDVDMKDFAERGEEIVHSKFTSKRSQKYWMNIFSQTYNGQINTWDYQWTFLCWKLNMLCVIPSLNMITNIGFDSRATHTKFAFSPIAYKKQSSMQFPLRHPQQVKANAEMDLRIQTQIFEKSVLQKLINGIKNYIQRKMSRNVRITS